MQILTRSKRDIGERTNARYEGAGTAIAELVGARQTQIFTVDYVRTKRRRTMGVYRIFYAGGSVDLGADDFHITEDGRVMFVRDKEYIACYVLANITGFIKVE